jgi:hypothetical protein
MSSSRTTPLRPKTLWAHRRYYGLDAKHLRDSSGRVVSRVVGLPPERARVRIEHVSQDFHLDTINGQVLVDEFVAGGLLQPRPDRDGDYFLTSRLIALAAAKIVEPVPRARAKHLIDQGCELAARINSEWTRNPLEIDALAAFGSYMSLDNELSEVDLGVIVRSRAPHRRSRWLRMASKIDGARDIRAAFRALSSVMHVQVLKELRKLPRPFAVVFQEA